MSLSTGSGALSPLALTELRSAADRVMDAAADAASSAAAAELEQQLDCLVDSVVELAADPDRASYPRQGVFPPNVVRALRRELLAPFGPAADDAASRGNGHPAADPAERLRLLSVLETLDEMEPMVERPASTTPSDFVTRLASPGALEAVIEVAHDMRSPLASILFLVDAIRRGQSGPVVPVQERQLGLIYSAALGLSTMASDVLDTVRGHRLTDIAPIPFSIAETIEDVCSVVRPIGEEKGLPILVVPPKIDGRVGYPWALHRLLLNLTTNALRYTDSGSVSVGCSELSESDVEFWVEDTGRGIPENVLAMLYDGFRPGSVGLRFSSAGLGLAICRSLLESLHSALDVNTALGRGTRFSFRLTLPPA